MVAASATLLAAAAALVPFTQALSLTPSGLEPHETT
jgi:hypothetical protein